MTREFKPFNPKRRVTGSQVIGKTDWLRLEELTYVDEEHVERKWSAIRRQNTTESACDAVAVIPVMTSFKTDKASTACIIQFRPSVASYTLEFPGGLIDENEDAFVAAERELQEETGYHGKTIGYFPSAILDPGISNVTLCTAIVHVDLDLPENQNPVSSMQDDEDIETFTVPLDKHLLSHLRVLSRHHQAPMFTGLEALALGIGIGLSDDLRASEIIKKFEEIIQIGGGLLNPEASP